MRVNDEDIPAHEIRGTDLGNVDQFVRQHKQVQGAIMIYIDHEGINAVSSYRTTWAREVLEEIFQAMNVSTFHRTKAHERLTAYVKAHSKHKKEK